MWGYTCETDDYILLIPTSPFSMPGPPTCTLCVPPAVSCPTEYVKGLPARLNK